GLLVDRGEEVAGIQAALDEARAGEGGVVLIEGPAGAGKSRLLSVAGDMARRAGLRVLGARATELERDFSFGVATQLFEPFWLAADEDLRARLLAGPARPALELLEGDSLGAWAALSGDAYPFIRGLASLLRNIVREGAEGAGAVVMLVDDVHWADRPSLRFLAFLATRCAELPVTIIAAGRTGEACSDPTALGALRSAAGAVLRPGPLSAVGIAAIVRSRLPGATAPFIAACERLTAGNPLLLIQLLDQVVHEGLPADAGTARRLHDITPEAVLEAVVARLASMPGHVGAVARALAILEESTSVTQVAELAGVPAELALDAADRLAAAGLLHPGAPLAFVHPLLAGAVRASIGPLDRGRAHGRAARILLDGGAPADQVAAQLLGAPAEADPRVIAALRASAAKALAGGAPESAVRLLERALAEDPAFPARSELLGELAEAEAAAGLPGALARLREALALTADDELRARLMLALVRTLLEHRRFDDAARVVVDALEAGSLGSVADDFDAALVAVARFSPGLRPRAQARSRELVGRLGDSPSARQRRALAEVALNAALSGEERGVIVDMVERAWGEGVLLEGADPSSWRVLAGALAAVDELERSLELTDAVSRALGADVLGAELVAGSRVWPLLRQGRVAEALGQAEAALGRTPDEWGRHFDLRTTCAALGVCLTERAEYERAEMALSIIEHPDSHDDPYQAVLLDARARLRLAQMRPAQALRDAVASGAVADRYALTSPALVGWRSTAALAHLALSDRPAARRLAAAELELARAIGLPRVAMRALRCLGLAERGARRLELLGEAVRIGSEQPARLEYVEALIARGAALRRANQRAAAREPLQRALELAREGGASRLAAAARIELAATGARSRRMLLGGVESLTPSELRVARLAASGKTTREMAEALFVTRKTIEYHLRHIYRKLDLSSRGELAAAMGDAAAPDAAH
ncbi:MAG TPA: AAA family ATPase, partial [Solirubrobacteraceae bacterium]|nr:AAA family ATPase [Solirubrobacteraceae bacterium]